jgi:hypothetical protein
MDDAAATALRVFISAYALLLDLPEDDNVVKQLARTARGIAEPGKLVILHGHGRICGDVKQGRYVRPIIQIDGPADREE